MEILIVLILKTMFSSDSAIIRLYTLTWMPAQDKKEFKTLPLFLSANWFVSLSVFWPDYLAVVIFIDIAWPFIEYTRSGGLSVNLYVIMIQALVIQCVLINRQAYCTTCQLSVFITKNTMGFLSTWMKHLGNSSCKIHHLVTWRNENWNWFCLNVVRF